MELQVLPFHSDSIFCDFNGTNLHAASSKRRSSCASTCAEWVESRDLHVGRSRHVIKLHSVVFHASMSHWTDSLHRLTIGDVRLLKFDRQMFAGMDSRNRCPDDNDCCCFGTSGHHLEQGGEEILKR